MSSQYALVGVRARPTHESARTTRHARNIGRRPHRSPRVPQNIGADEGLSTPVYVKEQRVLTDTLQDHVHGHSKVYQLYGFVEGDSYGGNCRKVDI